MFLSRIFAVLDYFGTRLISIDSGQFLGRFGLGQVYRSYWKLVR